MQIVDAALASFEQEHLDGAVRLSRQAGWPHRLEDWQMILSLSEGVVAIGDAGQVVGTILVTAYKADCAAINMVIVDETVRGRGLGRRLMEAALKLAGDRPLRLIATADGLPLYQKLGFGETGAVRQHQGIARKIAPPDNTEMAGPDDIPAITALDKTAFGADRDALIGKLTEVGEFAVIRRDGKVAGFAAVRAFGRGEVIGPVVAPSLPDAKALVTHFLSRRPGKFLRVDTTVEAGLSTCLVEQNLAHVGGGIAMALPPITRSAAPAAHTFALANQALG